MKMEKYLNRKSARSLAVVSVAVFSLLQLSTSSSWAADCTKKSDAKLPTCVNATAKPGVGSSMQTIQQAGAEAQKKATQGNVDTRTAGVVQSKREKRTWVGQTALTCKKGSLTLHLSAGSTQCPSGFHNS